MLGLLAWEIPSEGNLLESTLDTGIFFSGSSGNMIVSNSIRNSSGYGIVISGGSLNLIDNNTVSGNQLDGVAIFHNLGQNEVTGNRIIVERRSRDTDLRSDKRDLDPRKSNLRER